MFRSAFEGESCRFDIECLLGSCVAGACQSGTLRVSIVLPDGGTAYNSLKYLEKWPRKNDSRQGGVNIEPNDAIRLYGTVRDSFQLTNIISASKTTSIKFILSESQKVNGFGICLYGDYGTSFQDNNIYCAVVKGGRLSLEITNTNVVVVRDDASLAGIHNNIALGKKTLQSSLIQPGYSELGVDGNLNQNFDNDFWEGNSVTHTDTQISPWWEVDLADPTMIQKVVIYSRDEEYEDDLSDFTLTIYRADGVEADRHVFGGKAPSVKEFLFNDIIGIRVRISLNGNKERTLCLAEVQVYGPSFQFDFPIGELLNLPADLNVNRIAFVQDHNEFEREASIIENIEFYDSDIKGIMARNWTQIFPDNTDTLNIQGDALRTSSDDGSFIAMKSNSRDILVVHEGKPLSFGVPTGQLKSIAVSDEGIIIAGVEQVLSDGRQSGLGMVLIIDAFDLSTPKYVRPWQSGYGTGVDITSNSEMIAIGSPNERTVYTYTLKENGSFSSEHKIKHYDPTSKTFGWKVALGKDGQTIAVVSPSTASSAVQVGAIFVYVLIDDDWTGVAEILYGRNGMRKLGLGGIAINAGLARVDAKDHNDNVYSFMYENQCGDSHAFSEGIDGNAFRPRCKCMSGFKSSDPASGNILQTETDVCIACAASECGDRPTSSPTFRPTSSSSPTTGPTLSVAPTLNPTQSISPSSFPTTGNPTSNPTLTANPSSNPTQIPSTYGSVFDGGYCRYSRECSTFKCIDNTCVGETLSVTIPDENDGSERINAILVPFDVGTQIEVGGVVVKEKDTIEIFGDTFRAFKLSKSFNFNKNTRLEVNLINLDVALVTGVCVYETLEDENNLKQCMQLPRQVGQIDINVGSLLNNRRTKIAFIAFTQTGASLLDYGTFIRNIAFVQGANTDIVDENGQCTDSNALTTIQNSNTTCICDDGYVSSNGGKVQGELDSCISCVSSPSCFFEGDICSVNFDCDNEICDDGICRKTDIELAAENQDGGIATIMASLNNSFSSSSLESGGGIRAESENVIRIFGNVHKLYKFLSPAYVDKYTTFNAQLEQVKPFQTFRMCMYNNHDEVIGNSTLLEDERRCQYIIVDGAINIYLGEFFGFKITQARYFSIFLESDNSSDGEVVLSGLALRREGLDDYDNFSGTNCPALDANSAILTDSSGRSKCMCIDGFVASNGGKVLERYDTCVSTLSSMGGFDFSPCIHFRECASGTCSEGLCSPAGLLRIQINISEINDVVEGLEFIPSNTVDEAGGVILQPDNVLTIFGSTQYFFKIPRPANLLNERLPKPVNVNKYTKMKFSAKVPEGGTRTRVCLTTAADLDVIKDCPSSCFEMNGVVGETSYIVDVGAMFNDRIIEVNYIAFLQTSSSNAPATFGFEGTSIFNIQLVDDEIENVLDANGRCRDPNSLRLRSASRSASDVCVCLDGFVSSNDEKLSGVYDTCLNCLTVIESECFPPVINNCAMDLAINLEFSVRFFTIQASLEQVNGYGGNPSGGTLVPNPSTISIFGNAWNSYRLSSSYTFDYYSRLRFSLTRTGPVIGICFSENLNLMLSNDDISCFQFPSQSSTRTWGGILPRAYRYNIALGKSTFHSSFTIGGESNNAVDGRIGTSYTSQLESNPWFQVNLGEKTLIRQIFLYRNPNAASDSSSQFMLTIVDDDNAIQFQRSIKSNDEIVKITVPTVYGSGVKISLDGDSKVLSIGEIEVYDAQDGPVSKIDIPSGRLLEGKKVNYVTFIQEHEEAGVSQFYNLTFVYGSSEVDGES